MELQRQWDLEDRDEARAYSRDVYKHLVQDAEAAGFNPLTALRNGGGANYNAAAGMAPLSRKAPVRQAVGGSPVGDALTDFGNNFMQNFDPFADQKREQEYRLIESQIASLNAGTLSSNVRTASASYGSSDYERRPSGKAATLGKPAKWQEGDVNVTNPLPFQLEVNPKAADGAAFEDRYGEIGGSFAGFGVLAADVWHNVKPFVQKEWTRLTGPVRPPAPVSYPKTGGGGGW